MPHRVLIHVLTPWSGVMFAVVPLAMLFAEGANAFTVSDAIQASGWATLISVMGFAVKTLWGKLEAMQGKLDSSREEDRSLREREIATIEKMVREIANRPCQLPVGTKIMLPLTMVDPLPEGKS